MEAIAMVASQARSEETFQPRLEKASHEFEAQLMKELLRPMTSGDEEPNSGSCGALTDLASEALGQALSRQGGFGIATSILHSLSRNGKEPQRDPAGEKSLPAVKSDSSKSIGGR